MDPTPRASTTRPNLFRYATSELSQDAIICWLLAWAGSTCEASDPLLHRVGASLLLAIYSKAGLQPPDQFNSIKIYRQSSYIDIICVVNETTAILIEDKAGTKHHSDQLPRYKDAALKRFSAENIVPVYVQTGDQSDYREAEKHGYVVFTRSDLLKVLETIDAKAAREVSDILNDFGLHVRAIEDDTLSYAIAQPAEWSRPAWTGFYQALQATLGDGTWDYVPNPSGGFLGFWWHFQGDTECEQYLQLEEEKLCFKIFVADDSRRTELRDYWHQRILRECQSSGLPAQRPTRFGNGKYMTVAIVGGDYRHTDENGVFDLVSTISLLRRAEDALTACLLPGGETEMY